MDQATRQLIEAIHRAPFRCVLAATGGGSTAIALLLSVPGGSRTVLEAVVPYHEHALTDYLAKRPQSSCSAATARDLATCAYERASWLAPGEAVVGVGCTASLATDRPKRGDHRFYLALQTAGGISLRSLTLSKGARDRAEEEHLLSAVLLNALAEAFEVAARVEVHLLPGEVVQVEAPMATDPLHALLKDQLQALCVETDGQLRTAAPPPRVLLPGAFNPVHEGHWALAAAATRLTGLPVAFELSVINVDKPALPMEEVRRRIAQFSWRAPVWLTRAATFAAKARLFPGAVFVVGADTAIRIVAPRYYNDSEARMNEALDHIRVQGCSFLVAGRTDARGRFVGAEDLALPASLKDLFVGIPQSECNVAISSTQIRSQGA
jgi:hypothetical protein